MKIQCDVCEKEEAYVFCPADEAALCHGCDHSIHHANKLAVKHTRFPLHHPATSRESPLCDICQVLIYSFIFSILPSNKNGYDNFILNNFFFLQERRAFLFCREDRAILCRECDLPIHRVNEHTQNHNRFLLTGVKISSPSSSNVRSAVNEINRPHRSVSNENFSSPSVGNSSLASYAWNVEDNLVSDTGSVSTSSISEYFTEMIPSFGFEELLDASFATDGFCKVCFTD